MGRYVNLNSDVRFNELYTPVSDVNARYAETVEEGKGAIYGPYKENEAYTVVKVMDVAMRPDSMKASHILLQGDPESVSTLTDSIVVALKNNKRQFAVLAEKYSKDPGSAAKGGDLGWFKDGFMIKPFNDACIEAKTGEIVTAESNYGTHIIWVEDKSQNTEKVLLATLTRKVEPSTDTYRDVYSVASKFIGENNTYEKFQEAVAADNSLNKRTGSALKKNDKKVNDLEDSRELVRWAYKAEVGDLSDIQEFGEKFVIAALVSATEEGYRPFEQVSAVIKSTLLNDKKADYIIADIATKKADSQTLSSLAQKTGSEIKQAENISLSSYFIPGAGYEPALIGSVMKAKKDEVSEPVKGTSSVYVFRVVSETENSGVLSAAEQKAQLTQGYSYRVNYQLFNTLRDMSDIEDNRSRFY